MKCVTFEDVMQKLSSGRLDLLQIDAEGADGYILSLFPFDRVRPAIVHWESKNLTRHQQEEALDILRRQGYRFARPLTVAAAGALLEGQRPARARARSRKVSVPVQG